MNQPLPSIHDAHKPREIARLIELSGIAKAQMGWVQLTTLSVLAGVFIAFGGLFFVQTTAGYSELAGAIRLLGGVAFSLGLILVVIAGAELFTGNTMIVMALVDGKVSLAELLRNWGIVLVGNLIGSLMMVALVYFSGLLEGDHGARAAELATAKVALSPAEIFCRAILCNALVCLAVWMAVSARTTLGMIAGIVWPIAAFVAIGLEHSVANMYLLPSGWLAGADIGLGPMFTNIVFAILGNVVGGAGGVALTYRLAYGRSTG
ncbi:MAG: formate/nitrite transporter family protein [Pseudomonadota bacterium]